MSGAIPADGQTGWGATFRSWLLTGHDSNGNTLDATKVVSVSAYGAVGDGVTDDTAAIQNAINAVVTAGGGIVYFPTPSAFYAINGAQQSGTSGGGSYSGQIVVPARDIAVGPLAVKLVGASPSPQVLWGPQGGGSQPRPVSGSVLISNATSGNVFDCIPAATGGTYVQGNFTNMCIEVDGLTLLLPNNPAAGGFNLSKAIGAKFENATVGVNAAAASISQPTAASTVAGVRLPAVNNAALSVFRDSQVYGFPTGLTHSEHAVLDNATFQLCAVGINPQTANHLARYVKVLAQINRVHISVAASNRCVLFGEIAMEDHSGANWWDIQTDVIDASNQIKGQLFFLRYLDTIRQSSLSVSGATGLTMTAIAT